MNFNSGFFLFLVFLISCGSPSQDEKLSIFKYNQTSGIATLDPAFAKDQASIWACNQLFNGLVQLNEKLAKAVQNEDYELAAKIRDEITKRTSK